MDKDTSLNKKEDYKMVLLVCGDPQTGKKTIVNNWLKDKEKDKSIESKTFYQVYNFVHTEQIDSGSINIPMEIRILNGDEFETELKLNSEFFKGALGAFVTVSMDNISTFQDGEKWKEKLDLMCCLPNKFPLPIFLIINKCDKFKPEDVQPFQEKNAIDKYTLENQFFSCDYLDSTNEGKNLGSELISENDKPFKDMVKAILNFKDIKDKFVSLANGKGKKEKAGEHDGTMMIMDKKNSKCIIY